MLACGMSDGSLWLLDPLLLKPKPDMPILNNTDPITKIVFSFNSMYLALAVILIDIMMIDKEYISLIHLFH